MSVLTTEECQAIIDDNHTWESIDVTKKDGSRLHFNQSKRVVWGEQDPTILLEFVLKYEPGHFATLHTDSFWRWAKNGYAAYESWITPLNGGYEGGNLILDGDVIEQVIGVPIKFPILTPHEITEVTSGTRYSLVSWLFQPEPDWPNVAGRTE